MKIIITGNDGLIGRNLEEFLSKEGHFVIGLDKKNGLDVSKINDDLLVECLKDEIDLVIHCAANCIIRDTIENPELALENTESTFNILEFCRKVKCKRFIYFSSSRVRHNVYNPYISSKIYGEELTKAYGECYVLNYLIIRPETVWSLDDSNNRVITKWIRKALINEPLLVFGDKDKEMPPIHVDDFVLAFSTVLNDFLDGVINNSTISISGESMRVSEIIDVIKNVTGSNSEILYLPEEKTQPQKCLMPDVICGDFERSLKEELK